mgnify:CR=1 FL=1|jgi:hypothetical protein
MSKTNRDVVYEALLADEPVQEGRFRFKISAVVSDLRKEGFIIKHHLVHGYWLEIESVDEEELAVLQMAAHGGELAEQVGV